MRFVGGPIGIGHGVLQQLGTVILSRLMAPADQVRGFEVVGHRIAGDIRHDDQVGKLPVAILIGLRGNGKSAAKHAEDRIQLSLADR